MQSVRGTYENGQVVLDGEFLPEKSMLVIVPEFKYQVQQSEFSIL